MKVLTFMRNAGIGVMLLTFVGGGIGAAAANAQPASRAIRNESKVKTESLLDHQIHRQLVNLPWYNVFDNLKYRIDGGQVTLVGQVINPVTRFNAESSVKNLKGVSQVVNKIQVLPLSRFDNQIRWAEYRAIFSEPALFRYAIEPVPSIHIIVNNGHVTLTGYVGNKMDRNLAGIRARMVPNVFSVKNDLHVA